MHDRAGAILILPSGAQCRQEDCAGTVPVSELTGRGVRVCGRGGFVLARGMVPALAGARANTYSGNARCCEPGQYAVWRPARLLAGLAGMLWCSVFAPTCSAGLCRADRRQRVLCNALATLRGAQGCTDDTVHQGCARTQDGGGTMAGEERDGRGSGEVTGRDL